MKRILPCALVLFTLIATTSRASVVWGNPSLLIELDSGDPVSIRNVGGLSCPGNTQVGVNQTLTTSNYLVATLPEDTWCGLAIEVKWAGTSSWDLVTVDGFDSFVTEASEPTRTIVLDPSTNSATLE